MIRIPIKPPNWEAMVFSDETEALAMSFGPAIQLCVGSSRDTTFTLLGNPYGPGMFQFLEWDGP